MILTADYRIETFHTLPNRKIDLITCDTLNFLDYPTCPIYDAVITNKSN